MYLNLIKINLMIKIMLDTLLFLHEVVLPTEYWEFCFWSWYFDAYQFLSFFPFLPFYCNFYLNFLVHVNAKVGVWVWICEWNFSKTRRRKQKIRNHRNHSYIKGKGIFKMTISHFTIINNASIKAISILSCIKDKEYGSNLYNNELYLGGSENTTA